MRRKDDATMARNITNDQTSRTYRAKVTGRHAVTIPAEICRELGIETGDTIEFKLTFGFVSLRPAPKPLPRDESALDAAMGILGGYFESTEDVNRFIREGRGEWTEEDEAEYQKNRRLERGDTSDD
jgi:AbrB family looped-hinge helix DNA binding protein